MTDKGATDKLASDAHNLPNVIQTIFLIEQLKVFFTFVSVLNFRSSLRYVNEEGIKLREVVCV